MNSSLGNLAVRVERRLARLQEDRVVDRIWERDASLWPGDPDEIRDRLGWLNVLDGLVPETANLRSFANEVAADHIQTTVVLGMGGSSLAPAVLAAGARREVLILDSTHPHSVLGLRERVDIAKTLFVVSSKSGTTLETLSLFAYFWEATGGNGPQFVAITDEGSNLDRLGQEHSFRKVFHNPANIGGRFSALSYFGLVPAALAGVDLDELTRSAEDMLGQCRQTAIEANPGAMLGAVLGEAVLAGRDKLMIRVGRDLVGFGGWAEQLLAESTGKDGKGILPVIVDFVEEGTEPLPDQFFVDVGCEEAVREPGWSISADRTTLGSAFAVWEFATAVAGHILGVQPFNQPDVQSAKDATNRALAASSRATAPYSLSEALESLAPGSYLALLAYLPEEPGVANLLASIRSRLAARYGVAVTVGFGPRYLHSSGQLHKAGPPGGAYVIIEDEHAGNDVEIPGQPHSFGRLIAAQAEGDVTSLTERGRIVSRTTLKHLKELLDD